MNKATMRYTHDCDKCIPLGQFQEYDLYYCDQGGMPTVIARYGNDGPEYSSGLSLVEVSPVLAIAKEMAIALGLLKD